MKAILNQKTLIKSVKLNKQNSNAQQNPNSNSSNSIIDRLAKLCSYNANPNESDELVTTQLDLEKEFDLYSSTCNQCDEFSKYWQTFSSKLPILTAFVKRYSLISASSVSAEASFSIANYYQRKERSNLSSKSLRYSMILREDFNEKHHSYLEETN